MIRFSRFLFEAEFKRQDFPDDEIGGVKFKNIHYYKNVHRVGPHTVTTQFAHGGQHQGRYGVNFYVNSSISKGNVWDPIHQIAIGHHIAKTVHEFVAEKKPSSLHWFAADDNSEAEQHKGKIYHKFGRHLEKHFGGAYHDEGGGEGQWLAPLNK